MCTGMYAYYLNALTVDLLINDYFSQFNIVNTCTHKYCATF